MKLTVAHVVSIVLLFSLASQAAAQETTQSTNEKAKPAVTEKSQKQKSKSASKAESDEVPVVDMPTTTTWNFLGQEFWYPNRFNAMESLGDAKIHYRKGELRAAQAEVKEAITWLQLLKMNAEQSSKVEISSVIADLSEIAGELTGDKSVSAKKLNTAFANANLAIARHHFSKANSSTEKEELLNASRRLIAAADHMKNAASDANVVPSGIIGTFRDEYSPHGMVNETLELTPEQLKGDLEKLSTALKELSEKMKAKAEK